MKVLEALAAAIAAEGIDHIFAVMGDANQDIIVELCEKHGLKFVHAHHETSAVGMADGYARFSDKIGLASTTQGPGYTNATTSLVLARLHRSPVLMLAGHASLRDPYNPQGMIDQHALAKLTVEATAKIDHADTIDYCIGEAFRQLKAKKGPFVLNMPQDIQHSIVPDEKWTYRPMYKANALQPPRQEDVAQAAKILVTPNDQPFFAGLAPPMQRPSPKSGNWRNISAPRWQPLCLRQVFARNIRFTSASAGAWAQT
jgi:acetolactate synthase-1/2/3 large subunit